LFLIESFKEDFLDSNCDILILSIADFRTASSAKTRTKFDAGWIYDDIVETFIDE
jgi:hypothetical protein